MSDYEITRAYSDQESQAIRSGIREATSHGGGPWEYGHYLERYDGPLVNGRVPPGASDEDWTPLIYEIDSLEEAEKLHGRHRLDSWLTSRYRRSRVVRRAVSPWEVVSR